MNWIADIIIAALALAGTLGGAYFANRRSSALIAYRIQQLEQKVDKHNSVIERTYALEKQTELLEERLQTANRRIDDLETR
jgi:TolA-binding protein